MWLSVDRALRVRMEQRKRNMSHKSKLGPSQGESCAIRRKKFRLFPEYIKGLLKKFMKEKGMSRYLW